MIFYAGGYPNENTQGIHEIHMNDGKFTEDKLVVNEVYTTYFDVEHQCIATIAKQENKGILALYTETGVKVDQVIEGDKPCSFVLFDKQIYTANYHEAYVNIYEVNEHLKLVKHLQFPSGAKCHCVLKTDDLLLVVALGLDCIYGYDKEYNEMLKIEFPKGSGPRHVVMGKHDYIYVISELSNEVFVVDSKEGKIIQSLSILKDKEIQSSGAAIRLSHDGKNLYASTRGADLITHFRIDEKGLLSLGSFYECKGKTPRDFILSDDEEYMIIAYQDSNKLESVQLVHGELRETIDELPLHGISCLKSKKTRLF